MDGETEGGGSYRVSSDTRKIASSLDGVAVYTLMPRALMNRRLTIDKDGFDPLQHPARQRFPEVRQSPQKIVVYLRKH